MPTTKASGSLLRRLEAERTSRGLNQRQFAALLGMDPANYSKYKNGELVLDPLLSTVERYASRLKVPLSELVGEGLQTLEEKVASLSDEDLFALMRKLTDRLERGRR